MNFDPKYVNIARRAWRGFKGWFRHYIGGLYNRVDEHHIFLMSGGLSFSIFTCILPMVLIVFAVLGNILNRPSIAAEITLYVERLIPYREYADQVLEIVFTRVDEFILFKNLAGILGICGLFFAASGLFSSMRTILNTIFKVTSEASVLAGKIRDFILVIVVIIYLMLSTTILPGLDISQELADQSGLLERLNLGFLTDFLIQGFSLFIIFILFMLVYFFIPQQRPPKRAIVVSAIAAAIMWYVAHQLFGFYITNVVTLKRVYGAYFFLIVVAFWIYYTSLVFILGAEIGQLYRERRERRLAAEGNSMP
jgi:membrane protein